ncbi:hypothetical protein [Lentibacillus halophilus]|uniref:hypothetical protein n=1 Tax=Lentibacillus halophilus TaxID=295065 RepID=UPI0031E25B09
MTVLIYRISKTVSTLDTRIVVIPPSKGQKMIQVKRTLMVVIIVVTHVTKANKL